MIAWFEKLPEPAKLVGDGTALAISFSALVGYITTTAGAIGAIAGAIWAIIRLMNEWKTYKEKK